MKLRKQIYGDKNMIGKTIERLRKSRGIKQKDFIAKILDIPKPVCIIRFVSDNRKKASVFRMPLWLREACYEPPTFAL